MVFRFIYQIIMNETTGVLFGNINRHSNYSYFYNVTNSSDLLSGPERNISDADDKYNISNYDDYPDDDLGKLTVVFAHIERILSFSGIVMNVSTIVILLSLRGSLKTQFKLILSLALSDGSIALFHFLLSFFNFPSLFKAYHIRISDSDVFKVVFSFLYTTVQFSGLGTMFTIAVDVLIKVRKPFRYHTLMSKRRGNIIITCLWLIPALLCMSTALIFKYGSGIPYVTMTKIFVICSFLYCLMCLLFFFIFIIIYSVILCSVRTYMSWHPSRQRRSNTKMAVTFFFIILSYFVCIMPGLSVMFLLFCGHIPGKSLIMNSMTCLYILNTLLDPIIYAVRIPEIRARYGAFFRRLCHCLDASDPYRLCSNST